MGLVLGCILFGFVLGVVAVFAAEALGAFLIIKWLATKAKRDEAIIVSKSKSHEVAAELDPDQSLTFAENKQGAMWVLESDKIPEIPADKLSIDKRRKEILEVSPVKKYGKIKGQSLILTDPDGLHTKIQLKGCIVKAVSATSLPSKKWAKKFPIKVESKTSALYNGRKSLYVYLETSWDKEAWCKALCLASCDEKDKVEWFALLHEEFRSYLASLNAEYSTYLKPTVGSNVELVNRAIKVDGASSKVQKFLKKIVKKSSRVGLDNKSSRSSLSGRDERKNTEKLRAFQDADISFKQASMARNLKHPIEDNTSLPSSTLSRLESQSHASIGSDIDSDEKFGIEEGTLCWSLLVSRLFFDAISNAKLEGFIQAKIQNALSSLRTPSYVGEIICTGFHTGSLPPCIVGMRVLPMEMSEEWGFEVDIEYSGGALLYFETRFDVGELDNAPGVDNSDPDSPDAVDISSDLLQGLVDLGKHLNLSDGMGNSQDPKGDDEFNTDISKNVESATSCSTYGSRWKSLVNSIAKQVSQVPFSLTVGIASLRGTLRLQIKPPPSDQLWYGFTSMPDIQFNLESRIGERKITTGHLALFLINRIKALIGETLVVPNCESVCVWWMLAEKDDWVPKEVAPFKWVSQETRKESPTSSDAPSQPPDSRSDSSEQKQKKPDSIEYSQEPSRKSADSLTIPSSSTSIPRTRSLDDLTTPLLEDDKPPETIEQNLDDSQLARNVEQVSPPMERDDTRRKKMGTRERMLDLRRKLTEKFEEKKRHIEEKGRSFVDKMLER